MTAPSGAGTIAVLAALLLPQPANSADQIDELARQGRIPTHEHGYSDFTDPLGRFIDLLAAGAFADARTLQPDACIAWLATRRTSALTGKIGVRGAEIDLDTLCNSH